MANFNIKDILPWIQIFGFIVGGVFVYANMVSVNHSLTNNFAALQSIVQTHEKRIYDLEIRSAVKEALENERQKNRS